MEVYSILLATINILVTIILLIAANNIIDIKIALNIVLAAHEIMSIILSILIKYLV